MESANIQIRLNGSSLNVITKTVTPAEAVLLEKLNGPGSLFDFTLSDKHDSNDRDERERLVRSYKAELVTEVFPTTVALPKTFDAAGFDYLINKKAIEEIAPAVEKTLKKK
jgi:hypothetical protein